jgi:hypothetical protein
MKIDDIKVGSKLLCGKDYYKNMIISNTETEDVKIFSKCKTYKVISKSKFLVNICCDDDNYGHKTHSFTDYSLNVCF